MREQTKPIVTNDNIAVILPVKLSVNVCLQWQNMAANLGLVGSSVTVDVILQKTVKKH